VVTGTLAGYSRERPRRPSWPGAARPRARLEADVRGRRRRRPGGGEGHQGREARRAHALPEDFEPLLATGELGAGTAPDPRLVLRCPSARRVSTGTPGSLCSLGQPQCRKSPNPSAVSWESAIDCSPPWAPAHRRTSTWLKTCLAAPCRRQGPPGPPGPGCLLLEALRRRGALGRVAQPHRTCCGFSTGARTPTAPISCSSTSAAAACATSSTAAPGSAMPRPPAWVPRRRGASPTPTPRPGAPRR